MPTEPLRVSLRSDAADPEVRTDALGGWRLLRANARGRSGARRDARLAHPAAETAECAGGRRQDRSLHDPRGARTYRQRRADPRLVGRDPAGLRRRGTADPRGASAREADRSPSSRSTTPARSTAAYSSRCSSSRRDARAGARRNRARSDLSWFAETARGGGSARGRARPSRLQAEQRADRLGQGGGDRLRSRADTILPERGLTGAGDRRHAGVHIPGQLPAAGDRASDQFSFCVALWGLFDQHPYVITSRDSMSPFAISYAIYDRPMIPPPRRTQVPRLIIDALTPGSLASQRIAGRRCSR